MLAWFVHVWHIWTCIVWGAPTSWVGGIATVDFFVALRVCAAFRAKTGDNVHWSRSLPACFLSHVGGTTLTGILRNSSPAWAMKSGLGGAILFAWLCIYATPYDATFIALQRNKILQKLLDIICAIKLAFGIGYLGIETSLSSAIGNSTLSLLICGILCGCGGGLISDWLNLRKETTIADQETINSQSGTMQVAANYSKKFAHAISLSLLYMFVLRDPHNVSPVSIKQLVDPSRRNSVPILALINLGITWIGSMRWIIEWPEVCWNYLYFLRTHSQLSDHPAQLSDHPTRQKYMKNSNGETKLHNKKNREILHPSSRSRSQSVQKGSSSRNSRKKVKKSKSKHE